ncbi:hypothetical protein QR680_010698 [Steinernema hermaphroditum]|uniref:SKP1 component POZ domain-containing protein n=1 Tax=Steinernema hermaphroditum TaxID=289476 RepID=A0AA39IPU6_9BILA|nr:hypothetical protein QR680_010698 [Steinernema hermaphroditum]
MAQVVFVSSDNKKLPIDKEFIMKWSEAMKDMLERSDVEHAEIPMEKFNAHTLKKLFDWLEHHKDEAPGFMKIDMGMGDGIVRLKTLHDVPTWEVEFFKNETMNSLCAVLQAALFFDMEDLLNILGRIIAGKLHGQPKGKMLSLLLSSETGNKVIKS